MTSAGGDGSGRRDGWRAAGAVVLLAGAILYIILQVQPLLGDRGTGVTGLASHANDYKHLYLGSRLLAEGESPYDARLLIGRAIEYAGEVDPRFGTPDQPRILPYVYLPFTGFALRPLSALPFAESVVTFQLINHVLLIGGLLLAAWAVGWWRNWRDPWPPALVLLAVALNAAVFRQNNAGQLNCVLLFGMSLLFTAVVRRWHSSVIGLIAACLMLFKLTPGIFLIWFLLRREWKRAAWMAGWSLLLVLMTILLYGFEVHREFLSIASDMGYGKSTWAELGHTFWRDPYNQSVNALFHRLFVPQEGSGITPWLSLSPAVANALTWLVSCAVIALFSWGTFRGNKQEEAKPGHPSPRLAGSFSLAICTSLLLPSILWDHYLVQALLPVVLLTGVSVHPDRPRTLLMLSAVSVLLICLPVPFGANAFSSGPALLLMSTKLLPVALLFGETLASIMGNERKEAG